MFDAGIGAVLVSLLLVGYIEVVHDTEVCNEDLGHIAQRHIPPPAEASFDCFLVETSFGTDCYAD